MSLSAHWKAKYLGAGLPIVVALSLIPALAGTASATLTASSGAKATCKQLTKSEVQPLLASPVTKVKVAAATSAGQQCEFSGGGHVIDVLVLKGSTAKQGFQEDVKDMSPKVAVPGVGDKAYREGGDFQIDSIKGTESCSVSVGSEDDIPGVSALLTNGSSDLPESANATIATALGTICNRIYGKGNTKPSLAGLSASTTSGS
jgi:hypothetical protein